MKNEKPFVFRTDKQVRYELLLKKPHKSYKAEGICYDPSEKAPKIFVNPDQTNKQVLNTIIHEIAHAFFWEASEKAVTKFANTVARCLSREGWRREARNDPPQNKKSKQ
jgi:Zn-dependent peptidase ImmA (M78 family)